MPPCRYADSCEVCHRPLMPGTDIDRRDGLLLCEWCVRDHGKGGL